MLVDEEKQAVCAETGRETLAEKTATQRVSQQGGNAGLHAARRAANDEFYTRIEDVEVELFHYREHFRGKTVYLNCDDPRWSAFWRYFCLQFDTLGLERLIATHYTGVVDPGAPSFMIDVERGRDVTDPQLIDPETVGVQRALAGDGDFRSDECVELLEQSDIVVTNPPFSLARPFVQQLVEHGKQFVILGNMNAITYKEVWPLIQGGDLWVGATSLNGGRWMILPDDLVVESKVVKAEGRRVLDILCTNSSTRSATQSKDKHVETKPATHTRCRRRGCGIGAGEHRRRPRHPRTRQRPSCWWHHRDGPRTRRSHLHLNQQRWPSLGGIGV